MSKARAYSQEQLPPRTICLAELQTIALMQTMQKKEKRSPACPVSNHDMEKEWRKNAFKLYIRLFAEKPFTPDRKRSEETSDRMGSLDRKQNGELWGLPCSCHAPALLPCSCHLHERSEVERPVHVRTLICGTYGMLR